MHINRIDSSSLYHEYVHGKQSVEQLSERYHISPSTVRRRLSSIHSVRMISSYKQVVVLMDTTYWGRNFGVVVFKDNRTKRILWRKYVKYETLADYQEGVQWLEAHNFIIEGIVCDGLRGIFQMLKPYKVQMCQYHQISIVRRYLTNKPELDASKELLTLTKQMTCLKKTEFITLLEAWTQEWADFLKERRKDRKTGKTYYVHKRLRSAYLSLKRNMPYLWTWSDDRTIGIPNTNNALEGMFTNLKTKLRNHNGLSKENRKKFIDEYFRATFDS